MEDHRGPLVRGIVSGAASHTLASLIITGAGSSANRARAPTDPIKEAKSASDEASR